MTGSDPGVFSIGHSTHTLDRFTDLAARHKVVAVADVRSSPYSRYNPQFNKDVLQGALVARGIEYHFLGNNLGARPPDRSLYEGGRVKYARLAETELFAVGIKRVIELASRRRVALMCAEKDPLECHRTLLVARALEEQGVTVNHILVDGRLESQQEVLERLLSVIGLPYHDMFSTHEEMILEAMARQEERIAYVDNSQLATGQRAKQ
ncbi:MAG: DUF488 domain-containing protein [Armatimonadetes bacterium]|nr:DUF488 domain-containing protein [Armatimonadota bacterium]MDE2207403.1 DUF488 domain-containing protein [Armatimonadota bacterium]